MIKVKELGSIIQKEYGLLKVKPYSQRTNSHNNVGQIVACVAIDATSPTTMITQNFQLTLLPETSNASVKTLSSTFYKEFRDMNPC